MKKPNHSKTQFDIIVDARLFASDFGQPKRDFDFYRERSIDQIECAISNISKASNCNELVIAIAQANAFIDSAHHLELINLVEKVKWTEVLSSAFHGSVLEA
ncbi:hypothetical protein BRY75_02910 [Acinetobacter baumannii]|uniref:hypothetical protein n=1 Tax=Acinetobacter baumannii TaxID=470 RepID=UPI00092BB463|nr:hypothetical protein [Acinetobacter baumannii]OJK08876.1 hypothetical protein BRY75_02910 [Acinetobacter baumannii]